MHYLELVDKDGNLVEIEDEEITVTLKYTSADDIKDKDFNGGDLGGNTDTSVNNKTITVTFGKNDLVDGKYVITNKTVVDADPEGMEVYTLTVEGVTQKDGRFENVAPHKTDKSVTGTIVDGDVKVVLVAVDLEDANKPWNELKDKLTDDEGNLKKTNSTSEGGDLHYVAVAVVEIEGNLVPLTSQSGTVTLEYTESTNNPATLDGDSSDIVAKVPTVTLGEVFSVTAKDDYYAEGAEDFIVTISDIEVPYIGASIDDANKTVTSTITDNPAATDTNAPKTPTEPKDPSNPSGAKEYGEDDTVYVVISNPDSVYEGDTLTHYINLVDKDGNRVEIPADETITVKLTYADKVGTVDVDDFTKWTKEIELKSDTEYVDGKGYKIENITTDNDDGAVRFEHYTVTVGQITQDVGIFENIAAGYSDSYKSEHPELGDGKSTDGMILEAPVEIVLVAVTAADINPDGTVIMSNIMTGDKLTNTRENTTPEGGKLHYVALAVIKDGSDFIPLPVQKGGVTVGYGVEGIEAPNKTATLSGDAKDIDNNPSTATLGKVFSVDALDDFYAEGDEYFKVTISNPDNEAKAAYDTKDTNGDIVTAVIVNSSNDTVTSTITDNPANKDTESPTAPTEPKDPLVPSGDKEYGEDDTVYVVIKESPTVFEGQNLTHYIELVDKNGNPISIPDGETVTITLKYTSTVGTIDNDDFDSSSANNLPADDVAITVELDSNGKATIVNSTKIDNNPEDPETYTLTIDSITQSAGAFENITAGYSKTYRDNNALDDDAGKSVTGTIKDQDVAEQIIVGDKGGVESLLKTGMNYNIAFILDVSGSMKFDLDKTDGSNNERLNLLKAGLKQYIQNVVIPFADKADTEDGGHVNIALIPFAGTAQTTLKLSVAELKSGNWATIEAAIDSLVANGGTNYEAAFGKTEDWFKTHNDSQTNPDGTAKDGWENLTFFITDGNPTYYMNGTK